MQALWRYCYGEIDSFSRRKGIRGQRDRRSGGHLFHSIRNYTPRRPSGRRLGYRRPGGIFHADSRERVIENCYTTGMLTVYIGLGVDGLYIKRYKSCYTEGNVTGNDDVGGLAGLCNGTKMAASYATGDVDGNNKVGA